MQAVTVELIQRAREGHKGSCEHLARAFLPILFRYFRSAWQLRQTEAEELTQETFIEVWSSLQRFEAKAWRAWLMTIARRVAWKSLRAKPSANTHTSLDDETAEGGALVFESPLPTQEELVAMRQEFQKMHAYISCLRLEYRELLHLYYMEELSTEEISTSLDIPLGTVKTWLRRARQELKQQWTSQNKIKTRSPLPSRRTS